MAACGPTFRPASNSAPASWRGSRTSGLPSSGAEPYQAALLYEYWAIPIAAALLLVAYRRRDDAGTIAARVIPLARGGASRELDVSSRSAADASSRRDRAGRDAGRMAGGMRDGVPGTGSSGGRCRHS